MQLGTMYFPWKIEATDFILIVTVVSILPRPKSSIRNDRGTTTRKTEFILLLFQRFCWHHHTTLEVFIRVWARSSILHISNQIIFLMIFFMLIKKISNPILWVWGFWFYILRYVNALPNLETKMPSPFFTARHKY